MTKQCGEVQGRRIDRIDERNRRACYLCESVQGQHGIFMVESLHHMLITCPNVGMEALRVKLKADLGMLGATERWPSGSSHARNESVGDVGHYAVVYNE